MMVIDQATGKKANFGSKKTIIEAFKKSKFEKNDFDYNRDIQYKLSDINILKFY